MEGIPSKRDMGAMPTISAPKSNASYLAVNEAMDDIRAGRVQPVPEHLKNVHVKAEGKAQAPGYLYPHDYKDTAVEQPYLSVPKRYYRPKHAGYEDTIAKRMEWLREQKKHGGQPPPTA